MRHRLFYVNEGNKNNDREKARLAALCIYYGADTSLLDNRKRTALYWAKKRKLLKTAAVMERVYDIKSGMLWSTSNHKYCSAALKQKILLFLLITSFEDAPSNGNINGSGAISLDGTTSGIARFPNFINTSFTYG